MTQAAVNRSRYCKQDTSDYRRQPRDISPHSCVGGGYWTVRRTVGDGSQSPHGDGCGGINNSLVRVDIASGRGASVLVGLDARPGFHVSNTFRREWGRPSEGLLDEVT